MLSGISETILTIARLENRIFLHVAVVAMVAAALALAVSTVRTITKGAKTGTESK